MSLDAFSGSRRDVVRAILRSAAAEPEAWDVNEYEARHKATGLSVWIANNYYGVEVAFVHGLRRRKLFGEIAVFGRFVPWRRKLYHTFTDMYRRRHKTTAADIVAALQPAA